MAQMAWILRKKIILTFYEYLNLTALFKSLEINAPVEKYLEYFRISLAHESLKTLLNFIQFWSRFRPLDNFDGNNKLRNQNPTDEERKQNAALSFHFQLWWIFRGG